IPEPGLGQVRVRVEACGICHSDAFVKEGQWPGLQYPRIPGHEIAGVIDAVGEGVTTWRRGQRVGIGWHGGHCAVCDACRHGDFVNCSNLRIPGFTHDGGYAEYVVNPAEGLASIPDGLESASAAPLMCAGITTYNSLRNSGARGGDLVAILGIGGLGHLGVQFAHMLGFRTVAIARGKDKEDLARQLGADQYLDTDSVNAAQALLEMGGAKVALATAPSSKAMSALVDGLGRNGKLLIVGATPEPLSITPIQLIQGRRSVAGWPAGTSRDSEDTLRFAALSGVRPWIETFPLAEARKAFDRMITGKVRFRAVLTM
ncbi:MAG TPA: alcohol dehydrogenase, partial [Bryobacterales bacterium]|nr:alcohol dehydrogenase [Bryobacterales bacterium]